jgi:hypothetical protein
LDDLVAELFSDFASYITPISIAELTAADPDFATVRSNRTLVEWYFTATSALANYLLVRFPGVQRLTYLDGDLYFYASPLELLAEAHGASVQIIEHRFSPHLAPLEVYGRFNVGWISFFNTEEGRQVVADYRRECIEWCYDRLDGDRFADQKYLDRWPARYPRCCISRVKGGNVAPWNLARWRFDSLGGVPFVDAERIVFYHFHGVQRAADGSYGLRAVEGFEAYMELLYQPYLARLAAIEQELAPLLARAVRREIRYPDPNV